MPLVGLNFDKLLVDKKKPVKPPIKINSNLVIKDFKEDDMDAPKGMKMLRFDFEFVLNYDPKIAEVIVAGHVLYSEESRKADAMLKTWKKDKKFDPEIVGQVMNAALLRANIKALLITQEVGLPPHLQMPVVAKKKKKSSYTG